MSTGDEALFASSFSDPDRYLLWARMTLFADRIELRGWGWTGRHRRVIALKDVKRVQWWTGKGATNLALTLQDGGRASVRADAAGLWKHEIQAQAPHLKSTAVKKKSPEKTDSARAQRDDLEKAEVEAKRSQRQAC